MDKNQNNSPADFQQQFSQETSNRSNGNTRATNPIELPSISLPNGGGALKGIDEKFEVNTVNGTAGYSLPLPISSGRNGFSPALGLSYNSGAGNSVFGLGWQLGVPSIRIKTDKALPKYNEEDIYLLSGMEDLVPYLTKSIFGEWQEEVNEVDGHRITRYRPRTEGAYSRIEKVHHSNHGTFWKVTSRENIITIFGRKKGSRITDPQDDTRIFEWLVEFSYDDKGNWVKYDYKQEDLANVPNALSEKHRLNEISPITNQYLKSVKYGNNKSYYPDISKPYDPEDPFEIIGSEEVKHFFEVVLDYGEHDEEIPKTTEETNLTWDYRADAFSNYRPGFEIRTNRLCKRVLLFHKFGELGNEPCLIKSLDLYYSPSNINNSGQSEITYLSSAIQSGYIKKEDGTYSKRSLPPLEFTYQNLEWDSLVQKVDQDSLENTPVGLTNGYRWVDLYGEGISGILTEQSDGWYYKQNLGASDSLEATFSAMHQVAVKPPFLGLNNGVLAIQDMEANGEKQLVVNSSDVQGFYDINTKDSTKVDLDAFSSFKSIPNIDWGDSNTRFIDLNGDGRPELVISEESAFMWYESLGKEGYKNGVKTAKSFDEDKGPSIVFSDATQSIFLADFSGDGLTDIVRIRNSEVCYWPNTGYGRFGAKVSMDNAPLFDLPDAYNPQYLHLADVSGTGATDLVYLGKNVFKAYINLSGNGWSDAHEIDPFVSIDNSGKLSVLDFLGTGTSCLVWSTDLPGQDPMQYIDLMSSKKPHIMTGYNNGMGKEVSFTYRSSTHYYLKDEKEGIPWITKLPFPVQVLEKKTVIDHISATELSTSYQYHHGYYDYDEREFRGFGRVEQIDQESFETYEETDVLDMPPILTKTWIHTGSFTEQGKFSKQYQEEYYKDEAIDYEFPDSLVDNSSDFSHRELREAVRSLRGTTLRQEIYTLDGTEQENIPYTITETNFKVKQIQPHGNDKYGVYQMLGRETLTYNSERNKADPRIAHQMTLEHDEFGHPLKTIQIAYPRRSAAIGLVYPEQQQLYAIVQTMAYEHEVEAYYRLGLPLGQKQFEINGLSLSPDSFFTPEGVNAQLSGVLDEANILNHEMGFTSGVQAKLIGCTNNFYKEGALKSLALLDYTEQMIMSEAWAVDAFDGKVDENKMPEAGYFKKDNHWWLSSDKPGYQEAEGFYLPYQSEDTFGNLSIIEYDAYNLISTKATDAIGNSTLAAVDYRTLSVKKMTDINDSVSEAITDELGMVIATTVYGTEEGVQKGDSPITEYVMVSSPDIDDVVSNPLNYLQEATTFFYYHLEPWETGNLPPHFVQLQRETHVSELGAGEETSVQISLGYSDGFGRELQSKIKHSEDQWLVSGRTVYNNKEKPVKQYEPFIADTYVFQSEAEVGPIGVTPILYYDGLGRLIKTETPDGFHSRVEFDPWYVSTFDQNDKVLDSLNYNENSGLPATDPKKIALTKAAPHYNTPTTAVFDSLGREFRIEQLNEEAGTPLVTYTEYDIQGNAITQTDPRQYAENQNRTEIEQVNNFEYTFDLGGNLLRTVSQDAGISYNLLNAKGNPLYAWNARDYRTMVNYDALHRPIETLVQGSDLDIMAQKMVYGKDRSKNQNGQLIASFDQAGKSENARFDIMGQPLESTRQICSDYKSEPDWVDETRVSLESDIYTSQMGYDALGRVIKSVLPDGSVHLPKYHHIGWLQGVEVKLRGAIFGEEATAPATTFVSQIDYDAKGQRTIIYYGNGVSTTYTYDEKTFRLTGLLTQRQETNGAQTVLQDISYVYDPIGNIVEITDNSHDTVFNVNQQVDAQMAFVYDALYQLKEATGREHLALSKNTHQEHAELLKSTQFANSNDANQLGNYTRLYTYDDSGNLTKLQHLGANPFTRNMTLSDISNRAISDEMVTTVDVESYFDAAGNINQLEHLQGIEWNYRNNIASVTIIERDSENDSEYYVYDAEGQRIRKIKETYNSAGELLWKEEKIYLGGLELKRKYQGSSETLYEDSSALHVMDDKKRIAIVYYWNTSNDSAVTIEENKIHYQLGNH